MGTSFISYNYITSKDLVGYVAGIDNYAAEDCVLVRILEEAGAVLFVRTNVPQTLMVGNPNHTTRLGYTSTKI